MPRTQNLNSNIAAFLDMIAVSEGTAGKGDDGYNVIVGGSLFDSYEDHPRKLIDLPRLNIKSSAAGRYQLLMRYFDAYKKQFPRNIIDFSPLAQDWIALQQIRERKAIPLIVAGDFDKAVKQVSNLWASLPGAGYNQHEQKIEKLRLAYQTAGGVIA